MIYSRGPRYSRCVAYGASDMQTSTAARNQHSGRGKGAAFYNDKID